jgi:hypothetical protein
MNRMAWTGQVSRDTRHPHSSSPSAMANMSGVSDVKPNTVMAGSPMTRSPSTALIPAWNARMCFNVSPTTRR